MQNARDRLGCRIRFWLSLCFAASHLIATGGPSSAADRQTIVVKVPATDLKVRAADEFPVEYFVPADIVPQGQRIDLTSLEVRLWNPTSKQAVEPALPTRWYDAAIPDQFAVSDDNASATDGIHFHTQYQRRWGEFFPIVGDGRSGRLAWLHKQTGQMESHYEITFALEPENTPALKSPRREFIGDGSPRCAPLGITTTGLIHSRLSIADWNQDGLFDLVVGSATGNLLWYPNSGTPSSPKFTAAKLITTADGKPLDVGFGAAPLVVDWNRDGRLDLLCGAERNRVLYFQNEGTATSPTLVNRGFLQVDGKPLILPVDPVPNAPAGVFQQDYYPVLEAVDWNADGKLDLLAGGYITGRIFYYENIGTMPNGIPQLTDHGPLVADGEPLNVLDWAAAPTVADFDHDGDLDLISGNMPVTKSGADDVRPETFLVYFENVGARSKPILTQRPFPRQGDFPREILGTPRAVDFNNDGLLDLAVSSNSNLYLYPNVGSKSTPRFDVGTPHLPAEWGFAPLPTWGLQFLDFDGDGRRDFLSMFGIYLQKSPGNYVREELLEPGLQIDHPPPHGDPWTFTQLADLNGDGRLDLLFGTHEGHIYLHAADTLVSKRFDSKGVTLKLENGEPLHVGPKPGQDVKNFTILQGSRTTMTVADFDKDGQLDLVVGETDGLCYFFRNVGTKSEPLFAKAHDFESLGIRMVPFAVDWDRDGLVDVMGSAANGKVVVWKNLGKGNFAKREPLTFPPVPYGPTVSIADWNDDGDDDLIVGTAYGFFCWFERSFLVRGMIQAEAIAR